MGTEEKKILLHDLIECSDEKLISILYSLALEYSQQQHQYSEALLAELEERRRKHLSGESKSYTWEEVKERIFSKYKNGL